MQDASDKREGAAMFEGEGGGSGEEGDFLQGGLCRDPADGAVDRPEMIGTLPRLAEISGRVSTPFSYSACARITMPFH